MALEDADDLAGFFDPSEHGAAAVYTPAGGAARSVNGIHDRGYFASGLGALDAGVRSKSFTCRAIDVPEAAQGDALAIAGVAYTVSDVRPDASGDVVTLILENA